MRELARELKLVGMILIVWLISPISISVMAVTNKTAKYSLRDNPTGIYAKKGDEMYIYLSNIYEGAQISIIIQDLNGGYNNFQTIALKEGLNRVIAPVGG